MKETKIKLDVDSAIAFVKAASECDFDIDVNYNRVFIEFSFFSFYTPFFILYPPF